MRRPWSLPVWIAAGLLVGAAASPAFAQGEGGSTVNVFEMFFMSDSIIGVAVIYLLLAMSAVSIGLIVRFTLLFRRSTMIPEQTRSAVEDLLSEKKYRDAIEYAGSDNSYLGRLLSSAMGEAANGYSAMERAIEEKGDEETSRMLRPIELLNVLGNISPMLGLFGTVYGMIVAFQQLVSAGGKPDPASLAGGISTALVTTFWGLVVAMPALAAYALIRNKVDAITSEGLVAAEELISPFKPGKKSSSRQRATPQPEAE